LRRLKTKNKSGRQKNVMGERENQKRENAILENSFKRLVTQKNQN
jgi:hypothetical protein